MNQKNRPIPFATAEEMSAVHTALDDVREQMKEIETEFQSSTESSINREESLREYVDAGFKELHTQFNEAIKKLEQGIYDCFFFLMRDHQWRREMQLSSLLNNVKISYH